MVNGGKVCRFGRVKPGNKFIKAEVDVEVVWCVSVWCECCSMGCIRVMSVSQSCSTSVDVSWACWSSWEKVGEEGEVSVICVEVVRGVDDMCNRRGRDEQECLFQSHLLPFPMVHSQSQV